MSKFLEDTDRFAKNPNGLMELSISISKTVNEKESLEEKWMALEILKDELAAS